MQIRAMQTFQALADPTRARIVEMLAASGRLSAGEICRQFAASPPAVSQHLKVLKMARLVNVEAKAQTRIYSINRDGFREAQDWLKSVTELWTEHFDKLDDLLKSQQAKKK
jgi:DNA-binding transcriptional ArsR family regulator